MQVGGWSSSDILQAGFGSKRKKGNWYLYVSVCPQSILPTALTSAFALTPLPGWMKPPSKCEIRADRTEIANEEFPPHTILQWYKGAGNRDVGIALGRYVG